MIHAAPQLLVWGKQNSQPAVLDVWILYLKMDSVHNNGDPRFVIATKKG